MLNNLVIFCFSVISSVGFAWSVPYSWKRAQCVAKTSRQESDSFPMCPDISLPTLDVDYPLQASILSSPLCLRDQPDQSNHDAVSGLDTAAWTFCGWSRTSLQLEGRRERKGESKLHCSTPRMPQSEGY